MFDGVVEAARISLYEGAEGEDGRGVRRQCQRPFDGVERDIVVAFEEGKCPSRKRQRERVVRVRAKHRARVLDGDGPPGMTGKKGCQIAVAKGGQPMRRHVSRIDPKRRFEKLAGMTSRLTAYTSRMRSICGASRPALRNSRATSWLRPAVHRSTGCLATVVHKSSGELVAWHRPPMVLFASPRLQDRVTGVHYEEARRRTRGELRYSLSGS